MSQPAVPSPPSIFRPTRPIAAKPSVNFGANSLNTSGPSRSMATTGPITSGNGANTAASTNTPATVESTRPPFTFQFSAATEMILKRLRGESGTHNSNAALGIRSGATSGAVQPPGYEDVRRSVLQGMKTSMNMDIPPVPAKKNPKVAAAVVRTSTPTSIQASAVPVGGSGSGKGKATARAGKAKTGAKRKRVKDESESADDSTPMSGLGGDSESDGHGSVTSMPKQTLSGRKVVKPAQFNPSAVEGPTRKRAPYNFKRGGRSVEQALCKRCSRGHSPASNMIVFCDGCNIGWHQMCHDPMISDDLIKDESKEWFCNDCAAKRAKVTPPVPEAGKDAAWSGKSMDEKRAYFSTFPHSHLVSLLLQATIMHPDIPIFPASNSSPQSSQQPTPRFNNDRRLNVYPQQPFPPSATSTSGLFTRAEANPNAPINFIRKIQPGPFMTSFDHNSKPESSKSPLHVSSSALPALSESQPNQPSQDEDAEGEDESRASTPASPPYPRPGNGLMAKLPPDDQDLEWLVGEGEDDTAFSHIVFDADRDAQKVDERGMSIAGHA